MAMVKQGLSQTSGRLETIPDEEWRAQLEMLPDACAVSAIVSKLEPNDLREFAASIMNVAVDYEHKRSTDIEATLLLNGWFASMEETIAAGDELEEILSRRRVSTGSSSR